MLHVNNLCERLLSAFPSSVEGQVLFDELVVKVLPSSYHELMLYLKTEERFELMVDLCGVDYSAYREVDPLDMEAERFAVVVHLLSIYHNQRVRVRVFCSDAEFPRIQTISDIWSAADWYEREAFDLFGILFDGHLDLRRILTDYGFVGHPFRKDFPISGYVEMQYHQDAGRIMYQPVSIEPRENVPRIIREKHYGEME